MSAAHTPGPWIAECVGSGGNYDNPIDVYEVNNGFTRIAENLTCADARLVAAAPDLLVALQSSIAIIKQWHNIGVEDGSPLDVWKIYYDNAPEMQQIRAAIAKATK